MSGTEIRERDIEQYLIRRVKDARGEIRKVKWIGRRGAPDRIVFLKGCHWVELKAPGGMPRPEQKREHKRMEAHGEYVHVLDTFEKIDAFLGTLQ